MFANFTNLRVFANNFLLNFNFFSFIYSSSKVNIYSRLKHSAVITLKPAGLLKAFQRKSGSNFSRNNHAWAEYSTSVLECFGRIWDPFHLNNIQQLEKVQRMAARWVLNDFSRYSSVSAMKDHLSWPTCSLEVRLRLQTLYNIINEHCSLAIPPHFIPMGRSTRFYHPSRYVLPNVRTYSYQQNFYPRSIKDWNNLPSYLIECDNFFSWLHALYITLYLRS